MNDKKLIDTFENISNFDNFSKYSCSLDREFKDKSLKTLISSLKKYKPIEKENFIERFYKKYPYQFEEKKIIEEDDSMFEYINELKEKREREEEREKEKEKEKDKGNKSNSDKDSESIKTQFENFPELISDTIDKELDREMKNYLKSH